MLQTLKPRPATAPFLPFGARALAAPRRRTGEDRRARKDRRVSRGRQRLDLRGVAVLVVEDHPDSLEMLTQMVGSFGATVLTARDGREAIEVVSQTAPDLVLCDLVLPELNGFQFMDWLRAQPHRSRTPVIAVTALSSHADVVRTWSAGFDAHLVKPITYATIEVELERLFWAHRQPE